MAQEYFNYNNNYKFKNKMIIVKPIPGYAGLGVEFSMILAKSPIILTNSKNQKINNIWKILKNGSYKNISLNHFFYKNANFI